MQYFLIITSFEVFVINTEYQNVSFVLPTLLSDQSYKTDRTLTRPKD